jgi:ferredoxin
MVRRHGSSRRAADRASGPLVIPGTRLRVDWIACDGRGICAELLPEMITLDDWGFPLISAQEVPAGLCEEAMAAVRLCPKLALRLESGSR